MAEVRDIDEKRTVWIPAECYCNECGSSFTAAVHSETDNPRKLTCAECGLHSARIIKRLCCPTTLSTAIETIQNAS